MKKSKLSINNSLKINSFCNLYFLIIFTGNFNFSFNKYINNPKEEIKDQH